MIIVADTTVTDINRNLTAKNTFEGIISKTLKNTDIFEWDNVFYVTHNISGIAYCDEIIRVESRVIDEFDEDDINLYHALIISKIKDNLYEKEDITIIGDVKWLENNKSLIKSLLDTFTGNVYILGEGEQLNKDRILTYFDYVNELEVGIDFLV